jgi:integrase
MNRYNEQYRLLGIRVPRTRGDEPVEPIRELKDIRLVKKMLADNPRDLALFTIGINTSLRASDLVRLTVGQLRGLRPMDELELKERKTGNLRRISLNRACIEAVEGQLNNLKKQSCAAESNDSHPSSIDSHSLPIHPIDAQPFFISRRGGGSLTVSSVHRLVKGWCRAINLRGNYGSHTLRKTWGYHQRVTYGQALPVLCEVLGHSTQRQTLTYLCIQAEEIRSVYANEL